MNASFITCPSYIAPPCAPGWTGPRRTREDVAKPGPGLPAFRRTFPCRQAPKSAVIEATALGVFELWCNGERVGHPCGDRTVYDELKPGSTDFFERVYTYRYDLTPYLKQENTLVAVVASGWWSGRISFGTFGMQPLCFACELTLKYAGEDTEVLVTDESWECAVCGPTLFADVYNGEYTDARLPHPSDPMNGYTWERAKLYEGYHGKVEPRLGPPVRLRADLTLRPVSAVLWRTVEENGTDYGAVCPRMKRVGAGCETVTLRPGEHLTLDLGQNFAGRPRLTVSGACGTEVQVALSEMLNDSGSRERGNDGAAGTLYVENYRSARAVMGCVLRGGGEETFAPLYSYYGFRYMDITAAETVEILSVSGEVLTSDMPETGSLVTDNAEVNRFIRNVEWGRRSNYLHVPTDCPQRDERLGWTADTHIFCGAAAYLCDVRAFMRKWLCDARDSQKRLDGAYADVIPHVLDNSFSGRAAWGDAPLIIPDVLWRMYGDTETMREHYASMETYMEYLSRFGYEGGDTAYGDWLCYEVTDKRYIAVCYYAYDAALMEKYSRILSRCPGDFYDGRAAYYHDLRMRILAHFTERYVKDGDLTVRTQTSYLLALHFHLVEGELYERCKTELCRKIRENEFTLSTGFLGTGILAQTLSDIGEEQLAYSLLLQTRDPSWLYSVRQGATTVWERWNSYTRERGFGDVSMNSFNHYAYGAVLEWLYSGAAGIRPDEENPGFGHLLLAPQPDLRRGEDLPEGQTNIRYLRAHYDSVAGRVESEWWWEQDVFVWRGTVPAGITATVRFPALTGGVPDPSRRTLTVNGITYTVGELCGSVRDGAFEFELPAGRYEIR